MILPRLQLFEFNDLPWVPSLLREMIVEALSASIRWGGLLDGVMEPLARCLREAHTSEVLELCAGAGGPAGALCAGLAARGVTAHFLLSDLTPMPVNWSTLRAQSAGQIEFVNESVDATHIPEALGRGRVRVIVNALHHFPPQVAARVIEGAMKGAPGVFIAEGLDRNPFSFAAMAPMAGAAMVSNAFRFGDRRLVRALMSPLSLLAGAWDGLVSSMRMHDERELRAMVERFPGWTWESGSYAHSAGFGRGTWFYGIPKSPLSPPVVRV